MQAFFFIATLSFTLLISVSTAFVLPNALTRTSVVLSNSKNDANNNVNGNSNNNNDHGDYDIEAARERFEEMMMSEGDSLRQDASAVQGEKKTLGQVLTDAAIHPPPMTTIARERKIAEIHMLASLDKSDENVDRLWSIWYNERGPVAAQELYKAHDLMDKRQWDQAEKRLRDLVSQYGRHWPEPVNSLATLKFMKGELEESKKLCKAVLQEKPWHFGALSGIVMVCAGLEDIAGARHWAAQRLPPIQPTGSNRRRTKWVQRALEDARKSLLVAERSLNKYYGEKDRRNFNFNEDEYRSALGMDEDAWQ